MHTAPRGMKKIVTGCYVIIAVSIAAITVAAAANLRVLADVYAWLSPMLSPIAALPWARAVATQNHKFPLAEAHAVLALTGLVLIVGTAWVGAIRALRETVMVVGTDIASLSSALRENLFMAMFIPPAGWRSTRGLALPQVSPGDEFFLEKRMAGFDELVIRYYTHRFVLPGFALVILIAGVFFLFPDLIDGSRRSDPAWFFFGRLLVAIGAVYSSFALLLFISAHLSRASSGYRPSSNT